MNYNYFFFLPLEEPAHLEFMFDFLILYRSSERTLDERKYFLNRIIYLYQYSDGLSFSTLSYVYRIPDKVRMLVDDLIDAKTCSLPRATLIN